MLPVYFLMLVSSPKRWTKHHQLSPRFLKSKAKKQDRKNDRRLNYTRYCKKRIIIFHICWFFTYFNNFFEKVRQFLFLKFNKTCFVFGYNIILLTKIAEAFSWENRWSDETKISSFCSPAYYIYGHLKLLLTLNIQKCKILNPHQILDLLPKVFCCNFVDGTFKMLTVFSPTFVTDTKVILNRSAMRCHE